MICRHAMTRFALACLIVGLMAGPMVGPMLGVSAAGAASAADERAQDRAALVEQVAEQLDDHTGFFQAERRERVLDALRAVPRHAFVPAEVRIHAYQDRPLPIGHGQTISQPFIVALMTWLLDLEPGDRVLEIGTGSGYQAAVLAAVGAETYSIEIIPPLGERAAEALAAQGYEVTTRIADGYYGWEEHAPFDAVIVTAAASQIPPPLIQQLAPGGVMAIPVGAPFTTQRLMLVSKDDDGEISSRTILPVRFVPLTGDH